MSYRLSIACHCGERPWWELQTTEPQEVVCPKCGRIYQAKLIYITKSGERNKIECEGEDSFLTAEVQLREIP